MVLTGRVERRPNCPRMESMAAFSSASVDAGSVDLAHDVQRMFADLAQQRAERRHVVAGECMPVADVYVTERHVEIVLDLPGVTADAVRIMIKSGVVLIVGEKERTEPSKRGPSSFHLVERDFGRFARAVRLQTAVDAAAARATLQHGELRIEIPRRDERRGHGILVPIDTPPPVPVE